jgi:RNA polymerase sigma factor (sigma-70 family)
MPRTESALQLVCAAARSAGLGQRTDPELLAGFLDGDAAAFEALVRRHGPMVLRTCRTATRCEADAEDAFQNTFILLYRKAGCIRDQRSLAGWLFRVARRSAANARRAANRRDRRAATIERPTTQSPVDLSWREACTILYAEIDRLPESYRLPLVLCYLQGLARDEAARRLGWSLNEVRGRLERGRIKLRKCLEKRGITLSVGLLAACTAEALPSKLIPSALQAAHAAGRLPAMPLVTGLWKAGIVAGLAAAMVVGIAIQRDWAQAQPAPEKPKVAAELPKTEPPKKAEPEPPKTVTVSGITVGPDGRGVCTTKVVIRRQDQKDDEGVVARTGPDGRFQATVTKIAADTPMVAVADFGEGSETGWCAWTGPAPEEVRIVLAGDGVPIQGRILDLEGKQVAGVTVTVRAVHAFPDANLQAIVDWRDRKRPRSTQNTLYGAPPGAMGTVITGVDGKFQLKGIGENRVVSLLVTGQNIAHEHIYAATVRSLPDAAGPRTNQTYPASFDHLVAPARPIRGTARDADSGKPIPGLKVNGYGGVAIVTTDKDGRYELPGYKKGPRYTVYAQPPDGSVYFPAMAEAADTSGLSPLEMDLKVRAGVPVRGRLKDEVTGKPIVGTVSYWPLAGNTHVASVSVGEKPGEFFTVEVRTKPDGTFTCAALPGQGILTVTAKGPYQAARVDPKELIDETARPASNTDSLWIAIGGMAVSGLTQEGYQAIRLLKIDPAKPPEEQVIELTPAEPIHGRIVDPDGKPLSGAIVRGLHQTSEAWSDPLLAAEFTAQPPHPDRPRRLMFRHDGRKLIGAAVVAAGSNKPVDFKLEPWATLTGRLLDADGKPVAKASIYAPGRDPRNPMALDSIPIGTVFTDANGRFRVDGLFPGVQYKLYHREFQAMRRGGPISDEVTLKAGEERDQGDVKLAAK